MGPASHGSQTLLLQQVLWLPPSGLCLNAWKNAWVEITAYPFTHTTC